jgi:hypothetical protein
MICTPHFSSTIIRLMKSKRVKRGKPKINFEFGEERVGP